MIPRFYLFLSDCAIFMVHVFNSTGHACFLAAKWFNKKAKDHILHDAVRNL